MPRMPEKLVKPPSPTIVNRVQTGVRLDKPLLKALKALAEYFDLSLGELIEAMVLESFAGRAPFTEATLAKISTILGIYEVPVGPSRQPAAFAGGDAIGPDRSLDRAPLSD
jgi:hypothetical protein